jgi:8-oxo-dGTP diphosphatase
VEEETNLNIENFSFVGVTNDPNIDNNPLKHYITIFLRATVRVDSKPLENVEPHKCDSWEWISWDDLVTTYHSNREQLFDPLMHLIEDRQGNSPF